MPRDRRKCPHCKVFFRPTPSARHHQRYCSAGACQRARKAANNAGFRQRNPGYFQGPLQVERVRQWRAQHPGYWRRPRGSAAAPVETAPALQVVSPTEVLAVQVAGLHQQVVALQAVSTQQVAMMTGLTAHLTGVALPAELGAVLGQWYAVGCRLRGVVPGGQTPHPPPPEPSPECHPSAVSGAATAGPAVLQLGRSPPGA